MPRTILITGGSGKLGRVLVRHFLENGDVVVTNSRRAEGIAELKALCAGTPDRFHGFVGDLAEPAGARSLVEQLTRAGLQPDGLVNNARNVEWLRIGENGRVSRENFSNEFLVDVIVPYELTMELADQPGSRLRHVVNIGSQYGSSAANLKLYENPAQQSPLHYSVCKAAVNHLTRELAARLADRNILVNCVAFGGVEGRVDDAFKARYAALTPLGRMLREDDVPGPVDALLSGNFAAMTGQVLAVDGGWGIW